MWMLSGVCEVQATFVVTEIKYHSACINGQLEIVICVHSQCNNI